jgi:outer membrane lipoprotein-sorting protein
MHRVLLVMLVAVLALAVTVYAKPAQSVTAGFDGVMEVKGKSDKPFKISMDGKLYWSAPKLRVDFTQNLTQEDAIALVDFDKQVATLLYPDTLNGQLYDLKNFNQADYFKRVRDLVSTKVGETPSGWTSKAVTDDTAKAAGQTHVLLTGPGGEKVDLWRGKESKPVKMLITTTKWTLTLNLSDVKYGVAIPADKFTYSKDYTITKLDKLPEGNMSGL